MRIAPRPYRRRDRKRLALKSEPVICLHSLEQIQWETSDLRPFGGAMVIKWNCVFCGEKGQGTWEPMMMAKRPDDVVRFTGELPMSLKKRILEYPR